MAQGNHPLRDVFASFCGTSHEQEEVVLRVWEGKQKRPIGWYGGREDGSWRGVQNHSLDVCEITRTVGPHREKQASGGREVYSERCRRVYTSTYRMESENISRELRNVPKIRLCCLRGSKETRGKRGTQTQPRRGVVN